MRQLAAEGTTSSPFSQEATFRRSNEDRDPTITADHRGTYDEAH